jgi:uncharacterized protein YndB with AHSA1/START domain
MIKVEVSTVIARPIEEVFAFVTDHRNDMRWQDGLLETTVTPNGPAGVGTRIHEVRKWMGRRIESTGIITEYIPNLKSARKTLDGPTEVEGYVAFEPGEGGTKVTQHMEMKPGGFMALAEPLVSSGLRRAMEKNFGDLKDLLESGVLTVS